VNQLTHAERDLIAGSSDFADDHWHLFDTRVDMAENVDVSADHPEVRDRLVARWFEEADRNGVLPLSDGVMDRIAHLFLPWPSGSTRVEVRPGERVFEDNTPVLSNGFTITAHLRAPIRHGDIGVLAEQGDCIGAWVWFADGAALTFACSYVSEHVTTLTVDLPVGATVLRIVGRPDGDGMDLACDAGGDVVGAGRLPHPWPGLWTPNSSASLLAGVGRPLPVCDGYDPLVAFSGQLDRLVVEADGGTAYQDLIHQVETAFRNQ